MKTSTEQQQNGIQWTIWKQLEDFDFADDLALLPHTQQQMQEKTNMVAEKLSKTGPHHQQREEQGVKDQHTQQHTHHSPRRCTEGGGKLHLSRRHP
ncbi:hypothetical protein DPMN_081588 [Dreissena polymorpha]|uniref:Reverse transcriptase domain-containing protein n=1 Tax=Dreissena polymorpha TaxID=45954 RepID=A0A9D4BGN2_DREPO|nr:hypothetical protein DPMN_081588 [Dreissena polymorpha]